MKLNRTMMIAALIAGSMLTTGLVVNAQNATNAPARPPGGPMARGLNFDSIATRLELTDDQKEKAKPIFEDMRKKQSELRKDTTIQGADKRAKFKQIMDDTTAQLKEILNADQLAKWQAMFAGPHRPPGAGAPPAGPGAAPAPGGNTPPQ